MPAMEEWYTYVCSSCGKQNAFQVGAVSVGAQIPPGAMIATPHSRKQMEEDAKKYQATLKNLAEKKKSGK